MAPARISVFLSQKLGTKNGIIRAAILFVAWSATQTSYTSSSVPLRTLRVRSLMYATTAQSGAFWFVFWPPSRYLVVCECLRVGVQLRVAYVLQEVVQLHDPSLRRAMLHGHASHAQRLALPMPLESACTALAAAPCDLVSQVNLTQWYTGSSIVKEDVQGPLKTDM